VLDPNKADDVMLAIIIAAASSEYKNTKLLNNRMLVSVVEVRAVCAGLILTSLNQESEFLHAPTDYLQPRRAAAMA